MRTKVAEASTKPRTRTLRIEGVPVDLVIAFKRRAAALDKPMAQLIREMIAQAVEE